MNNLASIIIVTYNHKKYLDKCLKSVLAQDYPHEVLIVDNCSTDGTPQFIEENYPNVKLIRNQINAGYGGGNNLGVRYAKAPYIAILNPDTIVNKGWLKELIMPLQNGEKIITTSKVLTYDGSSIGTYGNLNHFTGLTFTQGLYAQPENYIHKEYVSGISGCSFAIKKNHYEYLGGFDENFFVYNEDSDFSWRGHLNNFKILYTPDSIVRHDWKLEVSPKKMYFLEKNRYMILRKYLSKTDLIRLLPSLIIAEFLTFGYAVKLGKKGIYLKCKSIKDGFKIKIDQVNGNKMNLFKSLRNTIPIDQLTFSKIDQIVKIVSNNIFKLNFNKMALYDNK